jgi:hypothetical protein
VRDPGSFHNPPVDRGRLVVMALATAQLSWIAVALSGTVSQSAASKWDKLKVGCDCQSIEIQEASP